MVKSGYKQTEIGMIPEEWSLLSVNELIEVLTDFTANGSFESLAENVTYLDNPDYARLVRLTDIRSNFKNKGIYVSKYSYDFLRKSSLQGGELLLANVGAYAGYSFLFEKNFSEHATLGPNMFLIKANKDIVLPQYMPFIFGYGTVFKQLIDAAASSAQPKINKDNVRKCLAIIPPIYVQERIAQVFSDVDGMISTLEKLVAKKKAIKQGAMQKLLTGKKRLSGFSGEWKSHQLRDLGEFLKGSGISRTESNTGKIPAVRYGELYTHHHNYVVDYVSHISKDVAVKAKQVYGGDILFAASGETKEEIGKCAAIISQETVYAGGDILIFRPSVHLNPIFMGTLLNTTDVCRQRAEKGQGDAIVHIHANSLGSIKIRIPEISEQDAIADILFEMDKEIKLLEQKLAKYRQVKQGMMQQLLTGKIRLV